MIPNNRYYIEHRYGDNWQLCEIRKVFFGLIPVHCVLTKFRAEDFYDAKNFAIYFINKRRSGEE